MSLNANASFYDILDISTEASPQDIREAYSRTKSTYNRDSVALYTMVSTEEREESLRNIEEAYFTLSHPERRREYDKKHGFISAFENPFAGARDREGPSSPGDVDGPSEDKVISIDRHPPMETLQDSDQLLIPPTTDFNPTSDTSAAPPPAPTTENVESPQSILGRYPANVTESITRPFKPFTSNRAYFAEIPSSLVHEIEMETEWKGTFIRKVRDAYRISLEEMSGITKITKTYLIAIEEDNYAKLPARIYVRGFVAQIAKVLKLPSEKVATAYLSRYHSPR